MSITSLILRSVNKYFPVTFLILFHEIYCNKRRSHSSQCAVLDKVTYGFIVIACRPIYGDRLK